MSLLWLSERIERRKHLKEPAETCKYKLGRSFIVSKRVAIMRRMRSKLASRIHKEIVIERIFQFFECNEYNTGKETW